MRVCKEDEFVIILLHYFYWFVIIVVQRLFNLLNNLKITNWFNYHPIKQYNEDSSLENRKRSGYPPIVRSPSVNELIFLDENFLSSRTAIKRSEQPHLFIVWLGVSYLGLTDIFVRNIHKRIQLCIKIQSSLTSWNLFLIPCLKTHWVLQQDSAPAHRVKSMQNW